MQMTRERFPEPRRDKHAGCTPYRSRIERNIATRIQRDVNERRPRASESLDKRRREILRQCHARA